jgi:hypothetical protein
LNVSTLCASFHGGSSASAINTVLGIDPQRAPTFMLAPRADGVLPALSELRGLTTDKSGTLYVVNAYKDFSQILTFAPPAAAGQPWTFSAIFAGGKSSQLFHPFCAVFGADGHLYVSNQDPNDQGSVAITYYEGPTMKHPGTVKGVFVDGFLTLRGIATNGTSWYVADEGNSTTPGSVSIFDANGKKQSSFEVKQPVHLLYDGSRYLYIGSEKDNAVYQYDTTGTASSASKFIESSHTVPIDHTGGLAISNGSFYVASRVGKAINEYPLTDPGAGRVYVSELADHPEFIAAL